MGLRVIDMGIGLRCVMVWDCGYWTHTCDPTLQDGSVTRDVYLGNSTF